MKVALRKNSAYAHIVLLQFLYKILMYFSVTYQRIEIRNYVTLICIVHQLFLQIIHSNDKITF